MYFVHLIRSLSFSLLPTVAFLCNWPLTYRMEIKYIRDYLESLLFFVVRNQTVVNDKPQLMVDLSASLAKNGSKQTDKTCNSADEVEFINLFC